MAFPPGRAYGYHMDTFDTTDTSTDTTWQPLPSRYGKLLTRRQAHSLALVLDSRSIPCCIAEIGASFQLLVPAQHLNSAGRELRLYEAANRNWPPALPAARHLIENTLPTVSVLMLLALLHNLNLLGISLPGHGSVDLYELGAAHTEKILQGEWWRLITALTLHADFSHLLSNLTIGGLFIILLCRELGSGLAWSLLLGSGMLGNLFNALVQSSAHRSVGASTAVFGAVGILAAISTVRYRHHLQRRWFVPVAAGLALLAILGTEGKQTDLGAHLFGFCCGILCGGGVEYLTGNYGRPGTSLNSVLALLSGAVVILAWWAAFQSGMRP